MPILPDGNTSDTNRQEDVIEVRDLRNGSWFWIQTHVWRDKNLSKADKLVYATFASYASQSDQSLYPSINKISKECGLKDRTVYYSIKNLETLGYIEIERNLGKPNIYTLVKTTPAKKEVPPILHPTPAKKDIGTPAKKDILTISNITISNNKSVATSRYNKIDSLNDVDFQEIANFYGVPESLVKFSYDSMKNWCEAKGRTYKNYKSALRNWVKSDAKKELERRADHVSKRGIDARNL